MCMLFAEELTEEVLMAHEQELTRLQDYYEEHKDLLDRVDRWKKLWSQFLEFEVCILMAVCSLLAAGKPGNVMELYNLYQGNVSDFNKNQGIFRENILSGKMSYELF